MQIFDQTNGPYWEVFANASSGLYAYLFDLSDDHVTYKIDKEWTVNTKFSLDVVISGGVLSLYYNGVLNQSISGIDRTNLYFKAGDYCQSSLTTTYDGEYEESTEYC